MIMGVCTHVHTGVHVCTHTHTQTYTCVHAHIPIYTHTHIQILGNIPFQMLIKIQTLGILQMSKQTGRAKEQSDSYLVLL